MLPLESTKRLTRALQELGLIKKEGKGAFLVTEKGRLLQFKHPYSLAQATELWAGEHQESWRNLIYSLQTQSSAFKNKYGRAWFDWLAEHPDKHTQYHEVLKIYSSKDYEKLTSIIDFDQHRALLDLGGSTGSLLLKILETHKKLKGILFDLPEVLEQVKIPRSIEGRLELLGCNFFENWPSFSVDGALLARILHDWSDEEAVKILKKVGSALSAKKFSAVYIVENILDETTGRGSLLDLNMLVMTAGKERNIDQFRHILREAGFVLTDIRPMNEVTSVLVARKASN
ncbi:MAG: hypothetical protein HYZ54_08030 [Ignavibacteriae bacterium]|nr:hypothetical protein [Ignavibacteriota bacterium]